MLVHPSSGACNLFVELFHGLYCSGSMCVSVTVRFGRGGVSGCRHRCVINSVVMWLHILVGPVCCVYVALLGSRSLLLNTSPPN